MLEMVKVTEDTGKTVWATFMLHEFVDLGKNASHVDREMKNHMGDCVETFLPVEFQKISSREFQVLLFEGYAFAKHDGLSDFEDRACSLRGAYVEGVLCNSGRVSYIPGSEIDRYRKNMKELVYTYTPEVGDLVEGVEGMFRSMLGVVKRVDMVSKVADVKFRTRTREVVAKNLSFIALAPKEEFL